MPQKRHADRGMVCRARWQSEQTRSSLSAQGGAFSRFLVRHKKFNVANTGGMAKMNPAGNPQIT